MNISYKNFRIKSFLTYKTFNPSYAHMIEKMCNSPIFPSSIIVTGEVGSGKSTFVDVLTDKYYKDESLKSTLSLYIDTPVDNSAQYCREVLQKAIKLSKIYRNRFFIIFDEAHILSFAAQQVFLSSIERENNLTICFITNDYSKICSALQNRSMIVNVLPFQSKDQVSKFASFVYGQIEDDQKKLVEENYKQVIASNIYQATGRDIINAILYGDFELYDDLENINSISEVSKYLENQIKIGKKTNINNILNKVADIIVAGKCICQDNKCLNCRQSETFLKFSTYVVNTYGLKLLFKMLIKA